MRNTNKHQIQGHDASKQHLMALKQISSHIYHQPLWQTTNHNTTTMSERCQYRSPITIYLWKNWSFPFLTIWNVLLHAPIDTIYKNLMYRHSMLLSGKRGPNVILCDSIKQRVKTILAGSRWTKDNSYAVVRRWDTNQYHLAAPGKCKFQF